MLIQLFLNALFATLCMYKYKIKTKILKKNKRTNIIKNTVLRIFNILG